MTADGRPLVTLAGAEGCLCGVGRTIAQDRDKVYAWGNMAAVAAAAWLCACDARVGTTASSKQRLGGGGKGMGRRGGFWGALSPFDTCISAFTWSDD